MKKWDCSSGSNGSSGSNNSGRIDNDGGGITNGNSGGVVIQAFCYALQDELHDYYRLLSILENELSTHNQRRNTTRLGFNLDSTTATATASVTGAGAGADGDGDEMIGNLNSAEAPSGLTILRLRAWMQEPLERMFLLARLVDSAGSLTGRCVSLTKFYKIHSFSN